MYYLLCAYLFRAPGAKDIELERLSVSDAKGSSGAGGAGEK
jgi:hypothetical protein